MRTICSVPLFGSRGWFQQTLPAFLPGAEKLIEIVDGWPGSGLFYWTAMTALLLIGVSILSYKLRMSQFVTLFINFAVVAVVFGLGFIPIWVLFFLLVFLMALALMFGVRAAVVPGGGVPRTAEEV